MVFNLRLKDALSKGAEELQKIIDEQKKAIPESKIEKIIEVGNTVANKVE